MSELHKVGTTDEIRQKKTLAAAVNGKHVAVFPFDDGFIATNGKCPHARGPLHQGEINGTMLSCPWHGWSYDLKTGICEEDPNIVLERFPVEVQGDEIFVRL
jgi:nitrite reductase (NADH) small subunit